MLGRSSYEHALTLKDKNEIELKSKEDVAWAFKNRIEKT